MLLCSSPMACRPGSRACGLKWRPTKSDMHTIVSTATAISPPAHPDRVWQRQRPSKDRGHCTPPLRPTVSPATSSSPAYVSPSMPLTRAELLGPLRAFLHRSLPPADLPLRAQVGRGHCELDSTTCLVYQNQVPGHPGPCRCPALGQCAPGNSGWVPCLCRAPGPGANGAM